MPVFHLDDETAIIRLIDAHEAAMRMARLLGIVGEVRTVVGRYREDGMTVGWTKSGRTDHREDILVEVFISKVSDEAREAERYAREISTLIEENKALRQRLAASGIEGEAEDAKRLHPEGESPARAEGEGDAQP